MGEPVKNFPLDIVKIEGPHETDSIPNNFIKTEISPEYNVVIENDCLPQLESVGAACQVDRVMSENSSTDTRDTRFHPGIKQETVIDDESDVSGNYDIFKQENQFEACGDDADRNSKCNPTHASIVEFENASDVLTTETVKEESCDVDKGMYDSVTSFDASVFPGGSGSGSQHKTGPEKRVQGFNTDIESGSLPEDDSNVEIDIADDDGKSLVDFPDSPLKEDERSQKGHGTEQLSIYKSFSQAGVVSKSLITTSKDTPSSHSVKRHDDDNTKEKLSHSSTRGKACQTFDKTFSDQSNLQPHFRTHTGEKPFECGTCGKAFSDQSKLRRHIRRTHTIEKPFECPTCGKAFSYRSQLEIHTRSHTGIKPFECPTCGKTFTRQLHLQDHVRSHTGEKPFECPTCDKAFSDQSNLQRHIKAHTGIRPFECGTCGKAFSLRISLVEHIRTHSGEKPFECGTCSKGFSKHSNLQAHIRTHTGEKPFECLTCGKAFSQQSHLKNHIRTHR